MKNLFLLIALFVGSSFINTSFAQSLDEPKVEFNIYPNPTISIINTSFSEFEYAIYDYTGSMVAFGLSEEPRIDVSQLEQGVYWLRVLSTDGDMGAIKFVKE